MCLVGLTPAFVDVSIGHVWSDARQVVARSENRRGMAACRHDDERQADEDIISPQTATQGFHPLLYRWLWPLSWLTGLRAVVRLAVTARSTRDSLAAVNFLEQSQGHATVNRPAVASKEERLAGIRRAVLNDIARSDINL